MNDRIPGMPLLFPALPKYKWKEKFYSTRGDTGETCASTCHSIVSRHESVEMTHVSSLSLYHINHLGSWMADAREQTFQTSFFTCGNVSVNKENLNPTDVLSKKRFIMVK